MNRLLFWTSHTGQRPPAPDWPDPEKNLVRLFPGLSAVNLFVAATPAISFAAGWWFKLWPDYREKVRERRQRQVKDLENLRVRLRADIAPWAGNEWDENSQSPDWYYPSFRVGHFEWEFVERFNRLVLAGEYPRQLTSGLRLIEELSRRFHESLAQHDAFRNQVDNDVLHRSQTVVAASRAAGSPLSDEALERAVPDLRWEGRSWLQDLYRRNKRIHVEGIGRAGQVGGLHEAWRRARVQIETTQGRLQAAGDPWWSWLGHGVAVILVLIGLLFVVDLVWSSLGAPEERQSAAVLPGHSDSVSTIEGAETTQASRTNSKGTPTLTAEQKELWSLDHPARIGCAVSVMDAGDSLIVVNSGYPVQEMKVIRIVFFCVRPFARPTAPKDVWFLIDDYYRDRLGGDYEGSQRIVFGFPWPGNLAFVRSATSGLVDSLNRRRFGYAGIEVGRAIKVSSLDRVGANAASYFWSIGAAGTEPSAMEPISSKRWKQLAASADSIRRTGRVLLCATKTPEADVQRVIRDCISAVTR